MTRAQNFRIIPYEASKKKVKDPKNVKQKPSQSISKRSTTSKTPNYDILLLDMSTAESTHGHGSNKDNSFTSSRSLPQNGRNQAISKKLPNVIPKFSFQQMSSKRESNTPLHTPSQRMETMQIHPTSIPQMLNQIASITPGEEMIYFPLNIWNAMMQSMTWISTEVDVNSSDNPSNSDNIHQNLITSSNDTDMHHVQNVSRDYLRDDEQTPGESGEVDESRESEKHKEIVQDKEQASSPKITDHLIHEHSADTSMMTDVQYQNSSSLPSHTNSQANHNIDELIESLPFPFDEPIKSTLRVHYRHNSQNNPLYNLLLNDPQVVPIDNVPVEEEVLDGVNLDEVDLDEVLDNPKPKCFRFFHIFKRDKYYYACRFCPCFEEYNMNTTPLSNHLEEYHPEVLDPKDIRAKS